MRLPIRFSWPRGHRLRRYSGALIAIGALAMTSAAVPSTEVGLLMLGSGLWGAGMVVVLSLGELRAEERMMAGFQFLVYLLLGLFAILDAGEVAPPIAALSLAVAALMSIGGLFRAVGGLLARGPQWIAATVSGFVSLGLGALLSVLTSTPGGLAWLGVAVGIEIAMCGVLGIRSSDGAHRRIDAEAADESADLLLYGDAHR